MEFVRSSFAFKVSVTCSVLFWLIEKKKERKTFINSTNKYILFHFLSHLFSSHPTSINVISLKFETNLSKKKIVHILNQEVQFSIIFLSYERSLTKLLQPSEDGKINKLVYPRRLYYKDKVPGIILHLLPRLIPILQ